jgi:glycosyltransferase involved in cell wall biosynthesis
MPVYNTKKEYLENAIQSILGQTFSDFNLIIVNDGSNNETVAILNNYAKIDSRIKIIEGAHKGAAAARNLGIKNADSEYIALMDSDDIALAQRFEKQVKFMDKHPEISISSAWYKSFPDNKIHKLPSFVGPLELLSGCNIACPCAIFRKSDIEKYDLTFNESIQTAEDYELWSRASKITNLANIQEVLLLYRQVSNSLSRENILKTRENAGKIEQDLLKFISHDPIYQEKLLKIFGPKNSSFGEKIFSIKNKWYGELKYKIITILGIEIKLAKKFGDKK